MLCRPFRAVFALIISYGDFDLPQNLFVDLADRRAECRHRARGVEIKDAEKILVFKVILRLHPAAGHEGVGDADRRGVFERHLDVVIIILLQIGIRNDAEDVAGMVAPVFRSKLRSDALELLRKAVFAGNAVITLQHGAHAVGMRVFQLPQVDAAGVFLSAGVGNVKDVFEPRLVAGSVDEGDARAAAPDIAPHLLVPEVVLRAGGGLRALHIDHELLVVGVFIQPCGGGQERRPRQMAAGDLPRGALRLLRVGLQFVGHKQNPPLMVFW